MAIWANVTCQWLKAPWSFESYQRTQGASGDSSDGLEDLVNSDAKLNLHEYSLGSIPVIKEMREKSDIQSSPAGQTWQGQTIKYHFMFVHILFSR